MTHQKWCIVQLIIHINGVFIVPKIRKAYYYKVIREAETPVVSAFFQDSKGDFDR